MASNNAPFQYRQQGFRQQQGNGFVRAPQEYGAAPKWPEYGAQGQYEHRQPQQQQTGLGASINAENRATSGNASSSSSSSSHANTAPQARQSPPSPRQEYAATDTGTYPHYTAPPSYSPTTTTTTAQSYPSTSHTAAFASAYSSTPYLDPQYRPAQQRRDGDYFDYTAATTAPYSEVFTATTTADATTTSRAAGYNGMYQTAEPPARQQTYSPVYQASETTGQAPAQLYQAAVEGAQAAESSTQGEYAPVYQTADAGQRYQQRSGVQQQQQGRIVTPAQQRLVASEQTQQQQVQVQQQHEQPQAARTVTPIQAQHHHQQQQQIQHQSQIQQQPQKTVTPPQIQHHTPQIQRQPSQQQQQIVTPSQIQHQGSQVARTGQILHLPQRTVTPSQIQHHPQPQAQTQHHYQQQHQQQPARTVTPSQIQHHKSQQSQVARNVTPAQAQHQIQHQPVQVQHQPQQTVAPSQIQHHSRPQPAQPQTQSIRTVASQSLQTPQNYAAPPPVPSQIQHTQHYDRTPTPTTPTSESSYVSAPSAPPAPAPEPRIIFTPAAKAAKPKPKPKPQAQKPQAQPLTIKTWTAPAANPPPPRMVGFTGGQQKAGEEAYEQQQKEMIRDNMARLAGAGGVQGQVGEWQQRQQQQQQLQQQVQHYNPPAPVPVPVQHQVQQQQQYQPQPEPQRGPVSQYHGQHQPQPQPQLQPQWVLEPQYPQQQPQLEPQQQQQQSGHPPQPQPQHQQLPAPAPAQPEEPVQPQRAPSEPRPLDKNLMEQQMKIMVERMRYYQAADPITFQAVWDNVRKSGGQGAGPAITAGSGSSSAAGAGQKVIMPGAAMTRSESVPGEVVYTPSQAVEVKVAAAEESRQQQQQQQQQAEVGPEPVKAPVSTPPLPPPPPDPMHLKTARAVSKYLIRTSGHCLPEEAILELLNRIKSFPALCDKLEAMGYQFHRGNFSRFLLAEVDGDGERESVEGETGAPEPMDVDVAVAVDEGESRVLGEVEDHQEQLLKEVNEARKTEMEMRIENEPEVMLKQGGERPINTEESHPLPEGETPPKRGDRPRNTAAQAESSPAPEPESAKKRRGRPRKSEVGTAPKTPTTTQINALPTPMSAAPTVPPMGGPTPVATHPTPIFRPSALQQPPSLGLRNPTPPSAKAGHTGPPRDVEMKQLVSPSLVYRPPTPPQAIEVDSSPSPAAAMYSGDETDSLPRGVEFEMRDQVTVPRRSLQSSPPKLTKIVKLRLKSMGLLNDNAPVAARTEPANDSVHQSAQAPALIDLTGSATPEPQMNRAPQQPTSAPAFKGGHNPIPIIPPLPLPVPQTVPAKKPAAMRTEPRLFLSVSHAEPLRRLRYDPATIAHDIQVATGRSPYWVRPLNAHLDVLRTKGKGIENADLETLRWDILDPNPMGIAIRYDAGIDDDDDGGYVGGGGGGGIEFGGVGVAVARAPVMPGNLATAKAVVAPVAVTPTPAARGRGRKMSRGGGQSILGASVAAFQDSEHGLTTSSNGTGSANGRNRRQTDSNGSSNGHSRTNGNSPGGSFSGFSGPTPRSGSRTGSRLRNVSTPDAGGSGGNFAVVIRSPSVSSVERTRAPASTSSKGLKRKLDESDKEKSTPAPKKITRRPKPVMETFLEVKPSGFKVFKCKWKFCPAELHNFETLHRHVVKAHCKLAGYGGYPCHWGGCSRPPTQEMKQSAAASRALGKVVVSNVVWDFDTPKEWEGHVVQSHLGSVKHEIGVGPSVGPYDHEAVGSDVDYLSDSFGHQITPLALPAPRGHIFLPPPGFETSSHTLNREIQRARVLGAGMEGDETADLRVNDDGQGIHLSVRRIVPAQDEAVVLHGSSSERANETPKGKGKGKETEKAVEKESEPENGAVSGADGGNVVRRFTIHDDEQIIL